MSLNSVGYERQRFADLTGSMLMSIMKICGQAEEEVSKIITLIEKEKELAFNKGSIKINV